MSQRSLNLMVALAAGVLSIASPAIAQINGPLDGAGHPSVGFIYGSVTADPCGSKVFTGCAGTLIAPDVVLTTGSCADIFQDLPGYGYPVEAVWVNFNPATALACDQVARVKEIHVHPGFDYDLIDKNPSLDIGVLVLEGPAPVAPAELPDAGELDGFSRGEATTLATYAGVRGPRTSSTLDNQQRRTAAARFMSAHPDLLTLALEDHSVCVGSEGGAVFSDSSDRIEALILLRYNSACARISSSFLRLDTQSARDFLDDFVTLP